MGLIFKTVFYVENDAINFKFHSENYADHILG